MEISSRNYNEIPDHSYYFGFGIINGLPVTGVLSVTRLSNFYGVSLLSSDLAILLEHRGVFFDLVGGLPMLGAANPKPRLAACLTALTSGVTFIAIAYSVGNHGAHVNRIVQIDIVASKAPGLAMVLMKRKGASLP